MASNTSTTNDIDNVTSNLAKNKSYSSSAVYQSQSSIWGKVNWVYGILTTIAVLVTIVVCVVEGIKSKKRNPTDYLLLVNIVCTSFIAVVQVWWYRRSHLAEDKVWFLLLIYTVLVLQCVTTMIYIVMESEPDITTTTITTPASHTTPHKPHTIPHHTKIPWIPIRPSMTTKRTP